MAGTASGTNAAALFGAGVPTSGPSVVNQIVITSASTGRSSGVAIGASSGTNAAALFGSGLGVSGYTSGGTCSGSSFSPYDFRGNEN
eukprot:SAG31_NODE_28363_length_411_cov_0.826923_1_plen_86_part_01